MNSKEYRLKHFFTEDYFVFKVSYKGKVKDNFFGITRTTEKKFIYRPCKDTFEALLKTEDDEVSFGLILSLPIWTRIKNQLLHRKLHTFGSY